MMGPNFGGGSSVNRLKVNAKEAKLLLRRAGENQDYEELSDFSGKLRSVDLYLNTGNKEKEIPPYWAYKFLFYVEGTSDVDGDYLLELGKESRFVPAILNVLAAQSFELESPIFYFSVYKTNGYPRLYFFQNGDYKDKFPWKYSFETDVPKRKETGQFDEFGNAKYDYSEIDAFWDRVFKEEVYPAVNKKPYLSPRDPAKTARLKKNSEKAIQAAEDEKDLAKKWSDICTWMSNHLPHPEDQKEIQKLWIENTGKQLNLDGSMGEAKEKKAEPASASEADDDDLPF
jgi:hypothetical protein